MSGDQPTNKEIIEAIQAFSTNVDGQFRDVNGQFKEVRSNLRDVDTRLYDLRNRIQIVDDRLQGVDDRLHQVENTMVTKEYLDERLFDLKADLALLTKKEDRKVTALIEELERQKVLSHETVRRIMAMEPYPQSV